MKLEIPLIRSFALATRRKSSTSPLVGEVVRRTREGAFPAKQELSIPYINFFPFPTWGSRPAKQMAPWASSHPTSRN